MKNLFKNKLALGLITLQLAFAGQAFGAPIELDSKDHIRVTIPAESAESARLIYGLDGNKVEAFLKNGEVIELNAELKIMNGSLLGNFSFLGYVDGSNNTIEIMTTDPQGYSLDIKFKSTGEEATLDAQVPLVLEATAAKMEVVQGGSIDEIQNSPSEPVLFTEQIQEFHQEGVLDIRIVIEEPAEDGETDGNQEQEGGNDENQPEVEATGGCSMSANAAASTFNLLGLLPLAGLALVRRLK